MNDQIKELLEGLLDQLGIENYDVTFYKDTNDITIFDIDTDEAPLLIGRHGTGLHSLERMLFLMAKKKFGDELPRIHVDIAGYRENFEARIIELANKKAEYVMTEDVRETFFPMNSYHRRMVHLHLAEHYPYIETDSIGEEPNRRLIIKKRAS